MPFHTQFGRFGDLANSLTGIADPDHCAANVIAHGGGIIGTRPTLSQVLSNKGFTDKTDPMWVNWMPTFGNIRNAYLGHMGGVLQPYCSQTPAGLTPGFCLHELAPPLKHGTFRWFSQILGTLKDNVQTRPDGSFAINPAVHPVWNFVITQEGEIVTGAEDFEQIKHTCLAGGLPLWAAGQLGIKKPCLQVVDLQSGHYVRPNVIQGTTRANALMQFTERMFKEYAAHFGITCLHSSFRCIWG